MDYQYIKAFLSVGRELNFTKAAAELKLTQSAISRQIKLLEENLGEQLLIRSPKSVVLTPRGKELFELWMDFEKHLASEFLKKHRETIKIGSVEGGVPTNLLLQLLECQKKQNISLEFYIRPTANLIQLLENSQLDILISMININNALVSSVPLHLEKRVLINYEAIPNLKDFDAIQEYIAQKTLIVYSEKDPLLKYQKNNTILMINSFQHMMALVEKNAGVALVPVHMLPKGLKVHQMEWPIPSTELNLTVLNFDRMSKNLQIVSNIIKDYFRSPY